MPLRHQVFPIVTDSGGNATVVGSAVLAKLFAIEYKPGSIVTGATLTLTCEGDTSKALFSKAGMGTTNVVYYPRDVVHDNAGTALTGTAGGDRIQPLMTGFPKVVVSGGGNIMSGELILYYDI
jgi:hypothetical protein